MKSVLIVGAGKGGTALLRLLDSMEHMKITAVVDTDSEATGLSLAKKLHIRTSNDWREWMDKKIDIIIEATGSQSILDEIIDKRHQNTVVIPGSIASIIARLLEEKGQLVDEISHHSKSQELILNNIHEGMVVINNDERISFINKRAEKILGIKKQNIMNQPIHQVIETTRLPQILRTRKEEIDRKLTLDNGNTIITTRIPIIDEQKSLKGAFAVFRDITDVVELVEQVTGLKEVQKLLKAIFQSSDEAISVVDEHGLGIMINPAYTKLTGLTEMDVIGKPATVDISEGESMHQKVLQTRRPFRGVRMKVGPSHKEVLVNVSPIVVEGKLKGSVGILHDLSEIQSLTTELQSARKIIRNLEVTNTFEDILGSSNQLTLALEQARVGAKTSAIVLIRGESGTGKELFAQAIHNESNRRHNKFIRVNCAEKPESFLEAELFGYDAHVLSEIKHEHKKGSFEEANDGTLLLDEIGELSLRMQTKLLQVLQNQEIIRVGGTEPIPINVRVIIITHKNLEKAVMNKEFREDFYYLLNRMPIYIPPLRERIDDLNELVVGLIQKINYEYGRKVKSMEKEAMNYLKTYEWPQNVRELENIIRTTMLYMKVGQDIITLQDLPKLAIRKTSQHQEFKWENQTLQQSIESHEKKVIQAAFKAYSYNKTKTAEALGISIRNLYYKMDKYGISK